MRPATLTVGLARCSSGLGIVLLSLSIVGTLWSGWERWHPPPAGQAVVGGVPGYEYPMLEPAQFLEQRQLVREDHRAAEAAGRADAAVQTARRLNDLVFKTLAHRDNVRVRWRDNWLQAFAGWFYRPLAEPQLPRQILWRRAGLCSDACQLLQHELQAVGIESAFVGLSGHVVLRVRCGERQCWADPDFGIFLERDVEDLVENAEPLARALEQRGYSEPQIRLYRALVQDPAGHRLLPPDQPLSPRLYRFAWHARYMIWLLPLLLILSGRFLAIGPRRPATARG